MEDQVENITNCMESISISDDENKTNIDKESESEKPTCKPRNNNLPSGNVSRDKDFAPKPTLRLSLKPCDQETCHFKIEEGESEAALVKRNHSKHEITEMQNQDPTPKATMQTSYEVTTDDPNGNQEKQTKISTPNDQQLTKIHTGSHQITYQSSPHSITGQQFGKMPTSPAPLNKKPNQEVNVDLELHNRGMGSQSKWSRENISKEEYGELQVRDQNDSHFKRDYLLPTTKFEATRYGLDQSTTYDNLINKIVVRKTNSDKMDTAVHSHSKCSTYQSTTGDFKEKYQGGHLSGVTKTTSGYPDGIFGVSDQSKADVHQTQHNEITYQIIQRSQAQDNNMNIFQNDNYPKHPQIERTSSKFNQEIHAELRREDDSNVLSLKLDQKLETTPTSYDSFEIINKESDEPLNLPTSNSTGNLLQINQQPSITHKTSVKYGFTEKHGSYTSNIPYRSKSRHYLPDPNKNQEIDPSSSKLTVKSINQTDIRHVGVEEGKSDPELVEYNDWKSETIEMPNKNPTPNAKVQSSYEVTTDDPDANHEKEIKTSMPNYQKLENIYSGIRQTMYQSSSHSITGQQFGKMPSSPAPLNKKPNQEVNVDLELHNRGMGSQSKWSRENISKEEYGELQVRDQNDSHFKTDHLLPTTKFQATRYGLDQSTTHGDLINKIVVRKTNLDKMDTAVHSDNMDSTYQSNNGDFKEKYQGGHLSGVTKTTSGYPDGIFGVSDHQSEVDVHQTQPNETTHQNIQRSEVKNNNMNTFQSRNYPKHVQHDIVSTHTTTANVVDQEIHKEMRREDDYSVLSPKLDHKLEITPPTSNNSYGIISKESDEPRNLPTSITTGNLPQINQQSSIAHKNSVKYGFTEEHGSNTSNIPYQSKSHHYLPDPNKHQDHEFPTTNFQTAYYGIDQCRPYQVLAREVEVLNTGLDKMNVAGHGYGQYLLYQSDATDQKENYQGGHLSEVTKTPFGYSDRIPELSGHQSNFDIHQTQRNQLTYQNTQRPQGKDNNVNTFQNDSYPKYPQYERTSNVDQKIHTEIHNEDDYRVPSITLDQKHETTPPTSNNSYGIICKESDKPHNFQTSNTKGNLPQIHQQQSINSHHYLQDPNKYPEIDPGLSNLTDKSIKQTTIQRFSREDKDKTSDSEEEDTKSEIQQENHKQCCFLCGTTKGNRHCDKCSEKNKAFFCDECFIVYHLHPKRQNHELEGRIDSKTESLKKAQRCQIKQPKFNSPADESRTSKTDNISKDQKRIQNQRKNIKKTFEESNWKMDHFNKEDKNAQKQNNILSKNGKRCQMKENKMELEHFKDVQDGNSYLENWQCKYCTFLNSLEDRVCQMCSKSNDERQGVAASKYIPKHADVVDILQDEDCHADEWQCQFCTSWNRLECHVCQICSKTNDTLYENFKRQREVNEIDDDDDDDVYKNFPPAKASGAIPKTTKAVKPNAASYTYRQETIEEPKQTICQLAPNTGSQGRSGGEHNYNLRSKTSKVQNEAKASRELQLSNEEKIICRRLQREGLQTNFEKAKIAAKLINMGHAEKLAVEASNRCNNFEDALKAVQSSWCRRKFTEYWNAYYNSS